MIFNTEIQKIFKGFKVGNKTIDVAYLFYEGHKDSYIVYSQTDTLNSYSANDRIEGVVAVYDFDIYSKNNYSAIAEAVREKLELAGWTWQPNRDSPDFYEKDTGLYHKTYCYAKPIQV